ncbi:MAG: cytochrome c [Chitinophagaceae bacterium]|nr:cytochrome c [Chitinophagaceae bacterium]
MMKKISLITICIATVAALVSCNKVRRSPGRAYMPDMTYSRAYETYASTEALQDQKVHYNAMPVTGTMAQGDMTWVYPYKNDSIGYIQSASVTNPLKADSIKIDMKEAERLYLIYCGICHGDKLDGNGPLWKDGNGPFPSKPKDFIGDDLMRKMPEGTMFHSVTYGKNNMGSYASQLSTVQRWMVIDYIKSKQGGVQAAKDTATTTVPKP